jgi:hypothetical protein
MDSKRKLCEMMESYFSSLPNGQGAMRINIYVDYKEVTEMLQRAPACVLPRMRHCAIWRVIHLRNMNDAEDVEAWLGSCLNLHRFSIIGVLMYNALRAMGAPFLQITPRLECVGLPCIDAVLNVATSWSRHVCAARIQAVFRGWLFRKRDLWDPATPLGRWALRRRVASWIGEDGK